MGDPFDFDDDGQVSSEEEAMAFLLIMDDDDEEEDTHGSHRGGCLSMVLMIVGITVAAVASLFLI